jgi:hypothetical protein
VLGAEVSFYGRGPDAVVVDGLRRITDRRIDTADAISFLVLILSPPLAGDAGALVVIVGIGAHGCSNMSTLKPMASINMIILILTVYEHIWFYAHMNRSQGEDHA